jgi:hypothetical protein
MRGDISAGQRSVRIDLEGDGDQRQDKNDDESSHGPVCRGRMRRNRVEEVGEKRNFFWERDLLPPDRSRFARVSGFTASSVFQMQSFVMSFAKAAFGWPVYATWNLVAYTKECRQSTGARQRISPIAVILFLIFTTWVWEALWVAVFWLLLRLAKSLSFV